MGSAFTRAWLDARQTPDEHLRPALEEALAQVYEMADSMGCEPDEIDDKLDELHQEVKDANEGLIKAEADAAEAESRLEEKLQDDEVEKMRAELEKLRAVKAENETLRAQVAAQASLSEDLRQRVADVLTMARKLASTCEEAGIKPAHVRLTQPKPRRAAAR